MPEHVSIERLSKAYPTGRQALRDVSIAVDEGDFLVILGPSGSGKTTLIRCLAGIERISSGRLAIAGSTVADGLLHVPPDRRELSMVFQDYALWPHLVARDNVAFALRRRGLSRAECRREALAVLERVGLGALVERYPSELSGGEQQRVALARALVASTRLILCDEPLSNLDADLRERMRVEISELVRRSGATTIYITHDQAEAFALADRVGVLEQGRLVQLGRPEEIYGSPATPFVARFTGLAGELVVRVRSELPAGGLVEVEPAAMSCARPIQARSILRGSRSDKLGALLAIRPTAVRLCSVDSAERHLVGTVVDVAFRDRGYEHAIDLPGQIRLNGILAPGRAARGETVGLRLEAAGCLLFSTEAPADAPDPPEGDGVRPAEPVGVAG